MRMHRHRGVGVIARGQLLYSRHVFEVEDDDSAGGEDDDLRLFGEEADLLEDAASLDEVGLRGGLADAVDGDHLVLLYVVGRNSHEVVSIGLLELDVDCVCLELEAHPQS